MDGGVKQVYPTVGTAGGQNTRCAWVQSRLPLSRGMDKSVFHPRSCKILLILTIQNKHHKTMITRTVSQITKRYSYHTLLIISLEIFRTGLSSFSSTSSGCDTTTV